MKHQLFRNNVYVEIDTGRDHLTIVGQVKDSTIKHKRIPYESVFNIPQESIELHPKILIIYENPEKDPEFIDDIIFIKEIVSDLNGIVVNKDRVFVSVLDLDLPGDEFKALFRKLNQRAKQINVTKVKS